MAAGLQVRLAVTGRVKLPYGLEAMLICKPCAIAADGDRCPYCEKDITLMANGTLRKHNSSPGEPTCVGYRRSPSEGHDLCKGCDCQHGPAGSLVSVPPPG